MGLFDRFPWVNTHELNLDWIIQKMKEWGADAAANVAKAETAATNAATAAENAATTAEPYAVRAEEASARATARAADCLEYTGECKVYSESAATAQAGAVSAEKNAKASETAAAQSAEEAKTATKWPYDGTYRGYLYRKLGSADPYTTTDMEFLTAPQENGVLFRVSGRIPKRGSFDDATIRNYHYEKILKMTGNVGSTLITFSGDFIPQIPDLTIAEAEPIGLVLFLKSNNSFYKYSSLPLISINQSNQFTVDSRGFEIPDDMVANIQVSLQNEGLSPSEVTAYLYVRMKYTF